MNAQPLTLFDTQPKPAVRRTDPIQSVSAAQRAADALPNRRARIMDALDYGPLCDEDLCRVLGEHIRQWPSVKSARSGLKKNGKVVATGIECREHHQMIWRRADRRNHAPQRPTQSL